MSNSSSSRCGSDIIVISGDISSAAGDWQVAHLLPWPMLEQRSLRNHFSGPEPTSLEVFELERRRKVALHAAQGAAADLYRECRRNELQFYLTFPSSRPTSQSTTRCCDPSQTVCTTREGGRMSAIRALAGARA